MRLWPLTLLSLAIVGLTQAASAQPANDLCANAIPISCSDVVTGSTVLSTVDGAPACPFTANSSGGVWYSIVGNGDQITLDTCRPGTNFETLIRVYTGSCGALACVTWTGTTACTPSPRARIQWVSLPGVEYKILVQGNFVFTGAIEMAVTCLTLAPEACTDGIDNDGDALVDCADLECKCTAACPPSGLADECCSAQVAYLGLNSYHHVGATNSTDAFAAGQCPGTQFGSMNWDVWLTWVAPFDGEVEWDTCNGASYDTSVAIYEGADCLTKQQIACNGNSTLPLIGCQPGVSGGTFSAIGGETYNFRIGTGVAPCCTPFGIMRIHMDCATPVGQLVAAADCESGEVTLGWDASAFDTLDIARDGVLIASGLTGSATGFIDPAPPNGERTYEVIGSCIDGGGATASITLMVSTYAGQQDLVVRGELPGLIDSAGVLIGELTALGRSTLLIEGGIGDYPCHDRPFQTIWNLNGTWPDYRCLTDADGIALAAAHTAGIGIYTEGADQWGYCWAGTAFADFDGISSATDGDDSYTAMDGADSGLGLDLSDLTNILYAHDQSGDDYTDRIVVATTDAGLAAAAAIWSRDDALGPPAYTTGVYGTGIAPTGNVISQSWEFGGFGGDRAALAARYVVALGGTVQPIETHLRGDCNNDGAVDIGDAIWTLARLFAGGAPGSCDDSCDSNDDGGIDIGDAVSVLAALFGATVPLPAPYPDCGEDPSADTLDCGASAACP